MSTAKLASQIASLQARLTNARQQEEQVIGAALLQIIRRNPSVIDGVVKLMKSSNVSGRAIKIIADHQDVPAIKTKEAGSDHVSHVQPATVPVEVPVATLPPKTNTSSAE